MKRKTEYISSFVWDKGSRMCNQDAVFIRQIRNGNKRYFVAMVCDGIAGLERGELASTYTNQAVLEQIDIILRQWEHAHYMCSIRKWINKLFYEIHMTLIAYSEHHAICMGTTASLVIVAGKKYYLFHIGDGRIYKITNKKAKCLTRDEVIQSKGKSILNHAMGMGSWQIPYYQKGSLRRKHGLLICSDGFYRRNEMYIREKSMLLHKINEEEKIQCFLETMVRRASQNGETDNSSAVYMRII